MDVQQLRCFLAVAEELHFGRAAERLHLTPSPVSRSVKELERELGTELFVRRYHQVELTSAGAQLVDRVRDILVGVDSLKAVAETASESEERTIRVGGTYLSPPAVMERFLTLVEATFPGRTVEVTSAPSSELLPDLERGQLDAALVHIPLERPNLDALAVARYTFVFAMRDDDPLASRASLTLADIVDRTLTVGPPTPQPVAMNRLYAYLRRAGVESFHQMPDTDSVALASHVRRSRGLALSLDPSTGGAAKVFDDQSFAIVPLDDDNLEFLLGVAWRRDLVVSDDVVREIHYAVRREWEGHAVRL